MSLTATFGLIARARAEGRIGVGTEVNRGFFTLVAGRVDAAARARLARLLVVDPDDPATISPYITYVIRRFGNWTLNLTPPAADPVGAEGASRVPADRQRHVFGRNKDAFLWKGGGITPFPAGW
ncbi:hypothetical protein ACFV0L_40075 [Streptosporangium canum]|uniref:hypothetical protein n=1 Tax=Streptosporangium canum TaxID=324952 RepID=UPI0036B2E12C